MNLLPLFVIGAFCVLLAVALFITSSKRGLARQRRFIQEAEEMLYIFFCVRGEEFQHAFGQMLDYKQIVRHKENQYVFGIGYLVSFPDRSKLHWLVKPCDCTENIGMSIILCYPEIEVSQCMIRLEVSTVGKTGFQSTCIRIDDPDELTIEALARVLADQAIKTGQVCKSFHPSDRRRHSVLQPLSPAIEEVLAGYR